MLNTHEWIKNVCYLLRGALVGAVFVVSGRTRAVTTWLARANSRTRLPHATNLAQLLRTVRDGLQRVGRLKQNKQAQYDGSKQDRGWQDRRTLGARDVTVVEDVLLVASFCVILTYVDSATHKSIKRVNWVSSCWSLKSPGDKASDAFRCDRSRISTWRLEPRESSPSARHACSWDASSIQTKSRLLACNQIKLMRKWWRYRNVTKNRTGQTEEMTS